MIHLTQAQHDEFKAAVAERDRLLALLTWMPIEGAPRDGTPIIIAEIRDGTVYDVCNGNFEVVPEDEEDGPWGINGGVPFCSYIGRAAGLYFCAWLPGREYEDRWRFDSNDDYTHYMLLPLPKVEPTSEDEQEGVAP